MSNIPRLLSATRSLPQTPAFVGQVLVGKSKSVCRLPLNDVEVGCPGAVMSALLALCDGQTSLQNVISAMSRRWEAPDVIALLTKLKSAGALVDGRDLLAAHWPYLENPACFGSATEENIATLLRQEAYERTLRRPELRLFQPRPSNLHSLLKKRSSGRAFSNTPVPLQDIVDLLCAGYGITSASPLDTPDKYGRGAHRTVPTAGQASALTIYYCNLRAIPGLAVGVYRLAFGAKGGVAFDPLSDDPDLVFRSFLNPQYLMGAQGLMVAVGNYASLKRKYGNRSALLCSIEAGHVMQNMYLAAAQAKLAVVEMCEFLEKELHRALHLGLQDLPLVAMIVGSSASKRQQRILERLPSITFRWAPDAPEPNGVHPLYVAEAKARASGDSTIDEVGYGRGRDARSASIKAIAEAQERLAISRPAGLIRARPLDLSSAVVPESIVRYSEKQYANPDFPFARFSTRRPIWWKEGINCENGQSTLIPADCVYAPTGLRQFCGPRHKPLTASNSSGVAAHRSPERALQSAALELIERHAFMCTWYGKLARPAISKRSIPSDAAALIKRYAKIGVSIVIKDLSEDLAPVICVSARDRQRGHFLVTAAADFEPEKALQAALEEAESRFSRWPDEVVERIYPNDVKQPADHERLYAHGRHAARVAFMTTAGRAIPWASVGNHAASNMHDLGVRLMQKGLTLISVDLSDYPASLDCGASLLSIRRAIIPGLVPIPFGRGLDPLGLSAVTSLLDRTQRAAASRGNPLFPHPFS